MLIEVCFVEFKYISCSYLSWLLPTMQTSITNSNTSHVLIYRCLTFSFNSDNSYSNTSHVLIYPLVADAKAPKFTDSNTSHVLIYRFSLTARPQANGIQIHLMFLFINKQQELSENMRKFKYISCSYLSPANPIIEFDSFNSNTSHVLIYRIKTSNILVAWTFKYISCSYLSTTRTIG